MGTGAAAGELPAISCRRRLRRTAENALWQAIVAAVGALTIILTWRSSTCRNCRRCLISSLIVVDSDPIATRHRGAQRIFGCIIGGTAALLVIALDATLQWWWTAMLFLGVFSFARIHLTKSAQAYIGTQSAIAYLGDDGQRRPADFHGTAVERWWHHLRG